MIWVKNTEDDGHDWGVYHKQLDATNPESYQLFLSTADARIASNDMWNNTKPTGSEFTVGNNAHSNASGKKYIAYLFAADQAAFGDSTADVISKTGTYNGDSGGPTTITLGWEPQMVMIKCITSGTPRNWIIMDKIRLMSMNRSGSSGLDGFQYMNLNGSADNGPGAHLGNTAAALLLTAVLPLSVEMGARPISPIFVQIGGYEFTYRCECSRFKYL